MGPAVVIICRDQRCRLDAAALVFQIPVTAKATVAGEVVTCRNVTVAQRSDVVDEAGAGVCLREIATVKEDVGILCQRL